MLSPSHIQKLFPETYDGFQAARVTSVLQCADLESTLRCMNMSYKTKIIKSKKRGREFIVMIVEKEWLIPAE